MDNTSKIVDKIIKSEKKKLFYLWIVKNNTSEASKIINEFSNSEPFDINEIFSEFKIAYSNEPDIIQANAVAKELSNKPKCPICQSTNLSKITNMQKATKIVAFGVFGMGDNGKTWKCNSCGSKF